MPDVPLAIILCKDRACRCEVARTDGVRVYGGVVVAGVYVVTSIVKPNNAMLICPRCATERRWSGRKTVDSRAQACYT